MLFNTTYSCAICKTNPDQISHHKAHIETQKHKDKRELFELKISKLSITELETKYNSADIADILQNNETVCSLPNKTNIKKNDTKKNETNVDIIKPQTMNSIIETITNKEALRDKIHEIHNYLRNNGAGYGMNGLKVFNILYGLKKIEENDLIDKVNLKRPECEFSYLLSLANKGKGEDLAEVINIALDSINGSQLAYLLFYDIPHVMKGSVFVHLVKEINNISIIEKTCNVLLSGKIYEYFIGRDESAISELGAYFTDRHIVEYILNKVDPCTNEDGTVPSMIDMFGGSGGFTTGYINYLNDKYPKMIDWKAELQKISHFDANPDVSKSAGLEFFCLTGVLPDEEQLKYKNSFKDEFDNNKYMYPLTNPPYGGDTNSKTSTQIKREKIKEYIKTNLANITDEPTRKQRHQQLKNIEAQEKQEKKEHDNTKVCLTSCSQRIINFALANKLNGNDKESCSLMLLMDILEVGGTAVGVLKEGVFFNKKYKDLRKCLVENFNVREVISVPSDQFENTSNKTSIVIFDNTPDKTSQVIFRDLIVEKYTEDKFNEINGDIVMVESKNDIIRCCDTLVSQATREEILGNSICSLNSKDYGKKEIIVGEGYELVKLGSICKCLTTTKHCTNIGKQSGKYKFYNSSQNSNLYVDFYEVQDYSIILGQGGNFNIHIDKNFTASKHVCVIQVNNPNNLLLQFIYYIIPELQKTFITNGSTIGWLNKTNIRDVDIPIPNSPAKIQEWVDKISTPYNEKNAKQVQIKELELLVQNRITYIGETEDCDEVELGSVCEKIKPQFNINTNELDNNGIYPFYNKIGVNIGYHSKYNYDVDKCIILTKDGGSGANVYGDNISLGGVMIITGQFASTYANFVLKPSININFTYYLLKNIKNTIMNLANYSVKIGHIQYDKLSKLKIKLPKNKQLIQELETTFQQIETLQNEVKLAEEKYQQLIQELSEEAMPSSNKLSTNTPPQERESLNTFSSEVAEDPQPTTAPSLLPVNEPPQLLHTIRVKKPQPRYKNTISSEVVAEQPQQPLQTIRVKKQQPRYKNTLDKKEETQIS